MGVRPCNILHRVLHLLKLCTQMCDQKLKLEGPSWGWGKRCTLLFHKHVLATMHTKATPLVKCVVLLYLPVPTVLGVMVTGVVVAAPVQM